MELVSRDQPEQQQLQQQHQEEEESAGPYPIEQLQVGHASTCTHSQSTLSPKWSFLALTGARSAGSGHQKAQGRRHKHC
jgi:hypothetical protein